MIYSLTKEKDENAPYHIFPTKTIYFYVHYRPSENPLCQINGLQ